MLSSLFFDTSPPAAESTLRFPRSSIQVSSFCLDGADLRGTSSALPWDLSPARWSSSCDTCSDRFSGSCSLCVLANQLQPCFACSCSCGRPAFSVPPKCLTRVLLTTAPSPRAVCSLLPSPSKRAPQGCSATHEDLGPFFNVSTSVRAMMLGNTPRCDRNSTVCIRVFAPARHVVFLEVMMKSI